MSGRGRIYILSVSSRVPAVNRHPIPTRLITALGTGRPREMLQSPVSRNSQFWWRRQTHKLSEHSAIRGDKGKYPDEEIPEGLLEEVTLTQDKRGGRGGFQTQRKGHMATFFSQPSRRTLGQSRLPDRRAQLLAKPGGIIGFMVTFVVAGLRTALSQLYRHLLISLLLLGDWTVPLLQPAHGPSHCREVLLLWAANWMEAYREEHGQQ